MIEFLARLGHQRRYWLFLVLLGLALESAALYYQYALDEWPCVLCIHVRLWLVVLILVAVLGVTVRGSWPGRVVAHGLTVLVTVAILERAWRLLGVERGTIAGECSFDLGLPAWLPLDQWFPQLFQVQEACGYTPVLPFGLSMAQVLPVFSTVLLLFSLSLLVATLASGRASS